MDMNKRDFDAIDRALNQYAKNRKITEPCPRCGKKLMYIQDGASYEVKCTTQNCVSEVFRGV